jgi:6,7-dimethyl-8-ribityllumazine synthase
MRELVAGHLEHGGFVSTEMHAGLGRFAATAEKTNAAGICTLTSCYEAKNREARRMLAGAAKAIVENKGRPESKFMDAAERVLEAAHLGARRVGHGVHLVDALRHPQKAY